jgi:hypothetical protein
VTGRRLGLVVLALLAWPRSSAAFSLNYGALEPEQKQVVTAGAGLESAFAASVGYGRVAHGYGWTSVVGADLTMVVVDPGDFKLRLGATMPVARSGAWMLTAKCFPLLRGAHNEISRMTSLGVEAGAGGGFFGRHWFVAADLALDWAATTYIAHSERYRATIYADAKDGWYSSTGTRLGYGLYGGYSWRTLDLVLRAGQARDLEGGVWYIPFYATIGINLRLP